MDHNVPCVAFGQMIIYLENYTTDEMSFSIFPVWQLESLGVSHIIGLSSDVTKSLTLLS